MTDQEAMKLALEALQNNRYIIESEINPPQALEEVDVAIAILRQALDHVPDTTKMMEPDMGIDHGAWDDVPDATKWVDELRGGDETEQEPSDDDAAWAKHLKEPMSEKRVHESDTMERHVSYVCPQCHWTLEQKYDQTSLELCKVCGWKTLIPDEGCLNCERGKPWVELTETERTNLEMLIIGQIQVTGLNVKGISNAIRAVEQVLKERNT